MNLWNYELNLIFPQRISYSRYSTKVVTISDKENQYAEALQQICEGFAKETRLYSKSTEIDYLSALKNISVDFLDSGHVVKLERDPNSYDIPVRQFPLREYFQRVIIEGVCYAFNLLHHKDLFTELMSHKSVKPLKHKKDQIGRFSGIRRKKLRLIQWESWALESVLG